MTSRLTEIIDEMKVSSEKLYKTEALSFEMEATRPALLASLMQSAPAALKTIAAKESWALASEQYRSFLGEMAMAKAKCYLAKRSFEIKEHEFFAEMSASKRELSLIGKSNEK